MRGLECPLSRLGSPWPHLPVWEPIEGGAVLYWEPDTSRLPQKSWPASLVFHDSPPRSLLPRQWCLGGRRGRGGLGWTHTLLLEAGTSSCSANLRVLSSFTQFSVPALNKGSLFLGIVFITQVREKMGHDYKIVHILHCKFVEKYICKGEILKRYFPGYPYILYSWKFASLFSFWDRICVCQASLSCYVAEDDLSLLIPLPPPCNCRHYRGAPSCLVYGTSNMLGGILPTDIHL